MFAKFVIHSVRTGVLSYVRTRNRNTVETCASTVLIWWLGLYRKKTRRSHECYVSLMMQNQVTVGVTAWHDQ